jgi:hypothetical protein
MASVIAYVDGFNLYHGLRAKYRHRFLWLDVVELARRIRPHDRIAVVKYFTAEVLDDPDALARQRTYLSALRAHGGPALEIVLGRFQTKRYTCRECNVSWTSYEEKETDVNIAVSLVADSAARASAIGLIISADSDLCPAIRTARSLNSRRGLVAAFPPRRSSFEISSLIRRPFTIAETDLRASLLPDTVLDPRTGAPYKRPDKWH